MLTGLCSSRNEGCLGASEEFSLALFSGVSCKWGMIVFFNEYKAVFRDVVLNFIFGH